MSVIILIFSLTWLFLRGVSGAAAEKIILRQSILI